MATAILGFIAANWKEILGYKRLSRKENIEIGDKLMEAIDDGRKKILEMYALVDSMEAANKSLKKEVEMLDLQVKTVTIERDNFKSLYEQAKEKLKNVEFDLLQCAEQVKKNFHVQHPTKKNKE